ncbi:transposase DDE domain protein [Rubidibacter lacunae KORDI 51-2]|uniref:Transposase DDE domain protein n=1 Tax=Rubidibacter lacunae KORDI 51-2 TaxID=582515 RepID=U5DR28_9CHRO|nr:transposase DDE domain protein [Rubidibacter lacunae KORDI 51-2]
MHDSQVLGGLVEGRNEADELRGDSAYCSDKRECVLAAMGMKSQIQENGKRNSQLTEEQNATDREKSKVRARVEHVFGGMVNEMRGKLLRAIEQTRTAEWIGLKNLGYNMKSYEYLVNRLLEVRTGEKKEVSWRGSSCCSYANRKTGLLSQSFGAK